MATIVYQMAEENTLLDVVHNVATLIGLPQPVDPAGSTDPAVQLMVQSANMASLQMANDYEWPLLTQRAEILVTTNLPPVPGQALEVPFDLPADFFRFVDQTQWNGSMQFPAAGPVSPQTWQTYMVFPVTSNFTLTWMVREGKIWFLNPPAAPGQKFKFMYITRALVIDGDVATTYKNLAVKNADKFRLDPVLITQLANVIWRGLKGYNTAAALELFQNSYDARVGATKGAPILSMARSARGYPYIGVANLPAMSVYGMPV